MIAKLVNTSAAALLAAAMLPATAYAQDMDTVRFASFNAAMNRGSAGALAAELANPGSAQPATIAEIIQSVNPDVLLINEFDVDLSGQAAADFQTNYLGVSQNGKAAVTYDYVYVAASNTGVASGFDLDNSGAAGDFAPGDAQGFGFFEGQFGFVIYSKYEIDTANIRTFQNFLWKDMPGALLPADPNDADGNGDFDNWYTPEELDVVRLSSKNHVDVPILVNGESVHFLAAHPTPPVFDGAEDRNGTRNHDEIRFFKDYVNGEDYIYDDDGETGGLYDDAKFVIVGDYNADPFDGDSTEGAANQFLDDPLINGSATDPFITPGSAGGIEQSGLQDGVNLDHLGNPRFDTADFNSAGPGNLRVDYALPSANMELIDQGVFWPEEADPDFDLVGTFPFPGSDHRLVYVDVAVPEPATAGLLLIGAGLLARRRRG